MIAVSSTGKLDDACETSFHSSGITSFFGIEARPWLDHAEAREKQKFILDAVSFPWEVFLNPDSENCSGNYSLAY